MHRSRYPAAAAEAGTKMKEFPGNYNPDAFPLNAEAISYKPGEIWAQNLILNLEMEKNRLF